MASKNLGSALASEVKSLTLQLIDIGLVDDYNDVVSSNLRNHRWRVGQAGADMSLVLKKQPYEKVYEEVARSGGFALRMLDGGLLQFDYGGHRQKIEKHRLAYLPAPDLEPYQNDPELYFGEYHFVDVVGHQVMPVPTRFDFDAAAAKDVAHPTSHLTLGQYLHCRIPVSRALTPSEFVNFILGSFYSTPNRPHERLPLKTHIVEETITENERGDIHVLIPSPHRASSTKLAEQA